MMQITQIHCIYIAWRVCRKYRPRDTWILMDLCLVYTRRISLLKTWNFATPNIGSIYQQINHLPTSICSLIYSYILVKQLKTWVKIVSELHRMSEYELWGQSTTSYANWDTCIDTVLIVQYRNYWKMCCQIYLGHRSIQISLGLTYSSG